MLQRQETIIYLSFDNFIPQDEPGKCALTNSELCAPGRGHALRGILSVEENPSPESTEQNTDDELEEAARTERDYLRQRLRQELQREPTEQELDEWLRQHTEGY
jgi:hypothetical protein